MENSKIIDRLKNDAEYYGEFGRKYLSASDIGTLLKNPKEFKKHSEDTKAMAEGRLLHQMILEPDKAKDVIVVHAATRNTKLYKEKLSELEKDFLLLNSEYDEVKLRATALTSNLEFYDKIYADDAKYEVPIIGVLSEEILELDPRDDADIIDYINQYGNFLWKGKADIVTNTMVRDIKTTADIQDFRWSARKYNYDSQAFIYQSLFGKPLEFLVVCKKTNNIGIFGCSDDFIRNGLTKVKAAIRVYIRYYGDRPLEDISGYYIKDIL